MSIEVIVDQEAYDKLGEPLKELYVKNGDAYVLDTDIAKHPRNLALVKAFQATKQELQKVKSAVPPEDDSDRTPVDERLQSTLKKHETMLQEANQRAEVSEKRANDLAINQQALSAAHLHGATKRADLVRMYVSERSRVDKNGNVFVVDDLGQPILKQGALTENEYLSVSDYVSSLKDHEVVGVAFESNHASGGDAQTQQRQQQQSGVKTEMIGHQKVMTLT